MKKCPYCKTLVNDDVIMCPNCCHDLSEISPMPQPINSKLSTQIYLMIFGILITIGSFAAFLSQRSNYLHFVELSKNASVEEEIKKFQNLANNSHFQMSMMILLMVLGGIIFVSGLIYYLIKKFHKNKDN